MAAVRARGGWALTSGVALAIASATALAEPRAVLELFTSQGCSSCPAADAVLASYADRGDVVALAFHVDYWDYLGWTDTFGSRENTDRQRGYAATRGDRQVYTPQIVVNGREHVVGSDRQSIERAIQQKAPVRTGGEAQGAADPTRGGAVPDETTLRTFPVNVGATLTDKAISITVGDGAASTVKQGTVWLVLYQRQQAVPIRGGENRNRTITYSNVVRKMQRVAMWKGKALTIDLPLLMLKKAEADGFAVLVQTENESGLPGAIIGAAVAQSPGI
ncbi:MAG: DUF1223 domain-containing protein [Bauldia sp.]